MAQRTSNPADAPAPADGATSDSSIPDGDGSKYTVVARRYRPKTFTELVGQQTVAHALLNAIETNRVGHAYLFTGARGVGKTSTARIFAKALNASEEHNGKFDPSSETAKAIDSGEDIDVLEIDGASNRGIDEIRQLRANAAVRPSRSRYKIYIIDEVHMLTTQAFNALLKTLEEPPGHVKFIFCTTDPEKIPITVLSRCQRFDFPPVQTDQILERLQYICENEHVSVDNDALKLIARRAAGSMRDSQSLLEQLLSFGGQKITVDDVHSMLGTADESRLSDLAVQLIERNAAGALRSLEQAANDGVDMGQLAEQLLGFLRDMMAVSVGGSADLLRTANPNSLGQLQQWGSAWGTMTLLAAMQLLDETIVRMRHSIQSRILLEIAMVQICNLQDLQSLSELVRSYSGGQQPSLPPRVAIAPASTVPAVSGPSDDVKKKETLSSPVEHSLDALVKPASSPVVLPSESEPDVPRAAMHVQEPAPESEPFASVTESRVDQAPANAEPSEAGQAEVAASSDEPPLVSLRHAAAALAGLAGQCVTMAIEVELLGPDRWKVHLPQEAALAFEIFQRGDSLQRLCHALQGRLGRECFLEFKLSDVSVTSNARAESEPQPSQMNEAAPAQQFQLIREAMAHPTVKQIIELFDGQVVRVDPPVARVAEPKMLASEGASNTETSEPTIPTEAIPDDADLHYETVESDL